jgi:3-methylfumaryl-CoA hydratase
MLDLDPDGMREAQPLPRGWQFILMGADTPRSQLRADGFPGLGVKMPELGLPRLLLGGRSVSFKKDIPIGACVMRTSAIKSLTRKSNSSGPMAIATIEHVLRIAGEDEPALIESQTYVLLPARTDNVTQTAASVQPVVGDYPSACVVPDETLLFQYSALGFNSHKIHIDRAHARNVEGFPNLVVNGGLVTLLMTEYLRREVGLIANSIKVKHTVPLFCGCPITMLLKREGETTRVQAFDHRSALAVDMEVNPNEF